MMCTCLCEGTGRSYTRCRRLLKSELRPNSLNHLQIHIRRALVYIGCVIPFDSAFNMFLIDSDEDTDTDSDEDSEEVYIKKPPNAFMLFVTEKRPDISQQLWRKGSSTVTSSLAAMVRDFYSRWANSCNWVFLLSSVSSGGQCQRKSSPYISTGHHNWSTFIKLTTLPGPPSWIT